MRTFNKRNGSQHRDALIVEARGLELIKSVIDQCAISEIFVPDVIECDTEVMSVTLIEQQRASDSQMHMLGIGLAKMHLHRCDFYGLDYDNYIGLNPQHNCLTENWGSFFFERRLMFQVGLISNSNLQRRFMASLNQAEKRLIEFLNTSCAHASLVHGDLWYGNVLFDEDKIWLIDPAVYYADREVDIAMTEMFGGFSKVFYESYQEICPLSDAYPVKKEIYHLYHFLNHYNLFGASYLIACEERMSVLENL